MQVGRLTFALCVLSLFLQTSTADGASIMNIGSIPGQPHIQVRPNPSIDGQTLTLTCVPGAQVSDYEEEKKKRPLASYGLPERVVWLNDSRPMPGLHSPSISVSADFDYPGWFQCQTGSSDRLSLPFVPRVSHLLISLQSTVATVEDGQRMTLTCLTSAKVKSEPFAMLNWAENDHEIKDSGSEDLTLVATVAHPSVFHCKVSSRGKTFISPPFLPQIYPRKPRIRRTGHNLNCDTLSMLSMPEYLWFLNGRKVDDEFNAALDLHTLDVSRGDRFTCQLQEEWLSVFSQLSHEYVLEDTMPKVLHSRKELPKTLESRSESECQSKSKPSVTKPFSPISRSKSSFTGFSPISSSKSSFGGFFPISSSKSSFGGFSPISRSISSVARSPPISRSISSSRRLSPISKRISSFRKPHFPVFKYKHGRRGFKNRGKGFGSG